MSATAIGFLFSIAVEHILKLTSPLRGRAKALKFLVQVLIQINIWYLKQNDTIWDPN
jgi:hypothetical protein